jgi:hypothetical protein
LAVLFNLFGGNSAGFYARSLIITTLSFRADDTNGEVNEAQLLSDTAHVTYRPWSPLISSLRIVTGKG